MKYLKSLMLVAVLLTTGCQAKEQVETPNQNLGTEQKNYEPVSQNKYLLGTIVTITLYDNPEQEIFDEIFNAIEQIEKEMTINNATTSEVISIN
ncbi:FAD:protein FMN transferase, partial [Turicibacter sanguinis]|nr:FAD:protein FMN transferase [Turicibacter sanguinis]